MGKKALPERDGVELLFKQHASSIFLLYFIHTCLPGETRTLMKEQAGDWLTNTKFYAAAQKGQAAVLRQAHTLSMQYYARKPRKKIKAERLKKLKTPFPMTDGLISILHLPMDLKSPVVLCIGLGIALREAGSIMRCSTTLVSKRLSQAKIKLNMNEDEIKSILDTVHMPETEFSNIYDRFLVDSSEKGYNRKRKMGRLKRTLDHVMPYISIFLLLLLLFAFLVVQFGWFGEAYGEYEYDYDTTPLISENSELSDDGDAIDIT